MEQRPARALLDQVGAHHREPAAIRLGAEDRRAISQVALGDAHRIGVQEAHRIDHEHGAVLLPVLLWKEPARIDQGYLSELRPDAVRESGPAGQTTLGDMATAGTGSTLDVGGAQD